MPQAAKIRGGRTKSILRDAIADLIPADLLNRRKQGFPAPMSSWFLEEDLGRLLATTLRLSPLVHEGYLDGDVVNRLAEQHLGRKRDHGTLLWALLLLTLWYRRWIQGERIA
jgi:asparagine synthase (glutamine-hydrolysing)